MTHNQGVHGSSPGGSTKIKVMAKKKMRSEVGRMLWTLNYMYNYLNTYGSENDYNHDFVLAHIQDVVDQVKKDKEKKIADGNIEGA